MLEPWGSVTHEEEAYYKRCDAEDRRKKLRQERIGQRIPFRKATMARVKSGEITLEEAQKIIRKFERGGAA